jgi:hypothetical protein
MGDSAIIFQVLGVIGLLFFFFLTFMNTKTWHWLHVTMMFFVLAAAATFMVFAALELKTRTTWMSKADKLEKDLETKVQANETLLRGPGNEVDAKTPSVISVREELGRVIVDRGRVWRGGQATINPDRTITVALGAPVADPAAVPAVDASGAPVPTPAPAAAQGAPQKHNIEAKTVLHVFKEYRNDEGIKIPRFYLGQFHVTAANEGSVTMLPVIPPSPEQAAEIGRADATWALYETAPVDSHEPFAGLGEDELRAIFPQQQLGLNAEQYNAFIRRYVRDGQAAEANDPPENVWVRVKFLKPHEVVVDSVQPINNVDVQPFDNEGQAQLSRLRRGKPVEFKPGDVGLFDRATADELIAQGIAGEPEPIFRRRLNDYEFSFNTLHRRMLALDQQMKDLNRDIATIKDGTTKAQTQIAARTETIDKLTADVAKVTFERDELTKYAGSLEGRVREVQSALSKLYAQNRALSRELSAISSRLKEEADRRAREATAMAQ